MPATLKDHPQVNRKRRGHDFYPPKAIAAKIPALGESDVVEHFGHTVVYVHYFGPSQDWYVSEVDPESGVAFGYADLGFGFGEWGYFSLVELEEVHPNPLVIIERDKWFDPQPFEEV